MSQNIHFNSQLLFDEIERRGIACEVLKDSSIIQAQLGDHVEYIDGAEISIMPSNYKILLDSKWNTKVLLKEKSFQVPRGYQIEAGNTDSLEKAIQQLSFPLVMKPEFGTHGYEVRMNIDSLEEAKEIFEVLSREIHYTNIVIEEQAPGSEFRLMITKNDFFGCLFRPYPKVIGDGTSSIEELIAKINTQRTENRINALCRIYIDNEMKRYLKKKGYSLSTVLDAGETLTVRSNSNVSTGGGCQEMSDSVHPYFRNIAQDILDSFPGLPYIGIDVITKDISKKSDYVICELNPSPGISLHTHPEAGNSQNLPKYMVDLLFPETIK